MIPAFIGCGLVLGIVNILTKSLSPETLGGMPFDQTTVGAILKLIGGGITFGLALFAGLNTSKEFGGTPILGGVLAAVLTMPGLSAITVLVSKLPRSWWNYCSTFVAIFAAWLEKQLRKVIPVALDLFVTPTLVLLVSGFLAIFIFATNWWCYF